WARSTGRSRRARRSASTASGAASRRTPRRSQQRTARTGRPPRVVRALPSTLVPHELAVARVELVVRVETAWIARRQSDPDRPAVTDHERRQLARADVVERR